jgi:hypothetical protein
MPCHLAAWCGTWARSGDVKFAEGVIIQVWPNVKKVENLSDVAQYLNKRYALPLGCMLGKLMLAVKRCAIQIE